MTLRAPGRPERPRRARRTTAYASPDPAVRPSWCRSARSRARPSAPPRAGDIRRTCGGRSIGRGRRLPRRPGAHSSVTSARRRSECTRCAITTPTTRSRSTTGITSADGGIVPPNRSTIESMLGSPVTSEPDVRLLVLNDGAERRHHVERNQHLLNRGGVDLGLGERDASDHRAALHREQARVSGPGSHLARNSVRNTVSRSSAVASNSRAAKHPRSGASLRYWLAVRAIATPASEHLAAPRAWLVARLWWRVRSLSVVTCGTAEVS